MTLILRRAKASDAAAIAEQFAATRRLLLEHRLELRLVDEAEVDEDLTELLEGHDSCRTGFSLSRVD